MSDKTGTRTRRRFTVDVPAGIERVLFLAATDEQFRHELMEDRAGAARRRGLRLEASERAVLEHAPRAQLDGFIDSLDTSVHNVQRRTFMKAVAASTAGLAAAGAVGCSDDDDKPPKQDTVPVKQDSTAGDRGIRVDAAPDGYGPVAGILPDGPLKKKDTLPVDAPMMGPESAGIKPG